MSSYYFLDSGHEQNIHDDPKHRVFRYKPIRRCWTCQKRFQSLIPCDRCFHVTYCSKECRKRDWLRHWEKCQPDHSYDQTRRAIIEDTENCLAIAYSIVKQENISPNRIYVESFAHSKNKENQPTTLVTEPFLNLYSPWEDVKFFLEKGLRPQIITGQFFNEYDEEPWRMIDFLADYGGEIFLSPISSLCKKGIKWFKTTDLDINEVFVLSIEYFYQAEDLLEMAKLGYDFYTFSEKSLELKREISLFTPSLDREIANTWRNRGFEIYNFLNTYLIPPLAGICKGYLNHN